MARDEPYNTADRDDVKAAAKEARQQDRSDEEVMRSIMITSPGRAWMFRKLVRLHIYSNPYSANPHDTAFSCGELNIGQMLVAEIDRACPDMYLLMMREANERAIVSDVNRNRAATQRNADAPTEPDSASAGFVEYPDEPARSSGNGKTN